VEFFRAGREKRYALAINDPRPLASASDVWRSAAQIATIGIFVLLFGAALYFCRPVLLPVVTAMVVGTTLAPVVKAGARYGVPTWVTAAALVLLLLTVVGLVATLIAAPVTQWIGRAPEIGDNIRHKLYVLDRPLGALRELYEVLAPANGNTVAVETSQIGMVTPVLAFVTPAVAEIVIFIATLIFFLAGQLDLRRYAASFFASREGKLRFIRIANDVEQNLAAYLGVVTVINGALGALVAIGAFLFGLPNPVIFGFLAALLNYIPYIGPACMVLILLGVGLVSFPSLGQALIAPAAFVGLTTLEGQFVTPAVLGRRLTLNPLTIFLSLAFWAWLWGPIGAFLAVPIAIIGLVTITHLFPGEESKIPE
jgi:predicted PurR-regulated permease PerM